MNLRNRIGCWIAILLAILTESVYPAITRLPIDLGPGLRAELSVDLDPSPGPCTRDRTTGIQRARGQSFHSASGYRIDLSPVETNGTRRFNLSVRRDDGAAFKVRTYGLHLSLPANGIRGVWWTQIPIHGSLFQKSLKEPVSFDAAANAGTPFILCVGDGGRNIAAAGWVDQALLTVVSARLLQTSSRYVIDLVKTADRGVPLERTVLKDAVYVRTGNSYWFDVAQEYARTVDVAHDYRPNPIPAVAWEPVYCSWYPYHDDIFEQRIWDNAVICKELGIRTFLIDAGWNTPRGGSWGDPSGPYGDYVPVKSQFPDFASLVRKMQQQLGLKVEVWAAPFWVGEASTAERDLADAKLKTTEEDYSLCPSHPDTAPHLRDLCTRIIRDYGADGIWMDFMDAIPLRCNSVHKHTAESLGAGFTDCARSMYQAITQVKPDAIIEYRMQHANLNNKPFANVWETTDTPFDYDTNRLLDIILRTCAAGMVVKGDPVIWRLQDSDATVGKYCATMVMSGVPGFSLDLPHLPESHRRILKSWIDFYKGHREALLHGNFRPFGADFTYPEMKIEGNDEAFIYLKSGNTKEVRLGGKQIRKVYILNCTDSDLLGIDVARLPVGEVTATTFDCFLERTGTKTFQAAGRVRLNEPVPQGGVITIEPTKGSSSEGTLHR